VLDYFAALNEALLYASLLSAAGVPLAAAWLRAPEIIGQHATSFTWRSATLVIVLTLTGTLLLFARLGGAFDGPTLGAIFNSGAGAALALQLTGAALLFAPVDEESGDGWRMCAALAMTASFAFNGHAAAVGVMAGLLATIHATAAAWWVGSLWLLRRVCVSAKVDDVARLVDRFSTLAIRIVAGLVLAGIVLIIVLIDFEASPLLTEYVLVLSVKLVLVALVLGLAIYNRVQLTRRLRAEGGAAFALSRTITAELLVIGVVLLVTAVLTTFFSPPE
jgi:putative copper export protein